MEDLEDRARTGDSGGVGTGDWGLEIDGWGDWGDTARINEGEGVCVCVFDRVFTTEEGD